MTYTIRVRGHRNLIELARRLEHAAAVLPERLVVEVRDEATGPTVAAVRAGWLDVEVTSTGDGGEHSGLRARTAAATRAEPIPDGAQITVESAQVDPRYGSSLVRGLNGMGDWVHPVFGTAAMTVQRGEETFFRTIRSRAAAFENRLERVIVDVAREIEG